MQVNRPHDVDGTKQFSVTLTPDQGQIMYFLVNASPKMLGVATSNFAGI